MNAPRKRRGPLTGGPRRDTEGLNASDRSHRRGEFQGRANARNARQPAPTWERPRGADALDALERAFAGAPAPRFRVLCRKANGGEVTFGTYAKRVEAEHAVKLLRWAGSVARVAEGDAP